MTWRIGTIVQNDGGIAVMTWDLEDEEDKRVAVVDDYETPEGKLNASLISAAPDLLAACRDSLHAIENRYLPDRDSPAAKDIRAAIDKATGALR